MVQNNPIAMNGLQKNILEHISLMAQEQVQLEFVQEIQELQQLTQQLGPMMQNPQAMMQNPMMMQSQQRIQKITSDIEARKAKLIAEMTEDYAKEEEKIIAFILSKSNLSWPSCFFLWFSCARRSNSLPFSLNNGSPPYSPMIFSSSFA